MCKGRYGRREGKFARFGKIYRWKTQEVLPLVRRKWFYKKKKEREKKPRQEI